MMLLNESYGTQILDNQCGYEKRDDQIALYNTFPYITKTHLVY